MAKYRKKPVVIEAWLYDGTEESEGEILALSDRIFLVAEMNKPDHIEIETLEGHMIASVGDWIIRGVEGEFYPCKPSVFAATYDLVEGA